MRQLAARSVALFVLGACQRDEQSNANTQRLVVSAPELPSEALDAVRIKPRTFVTRVERRGTSLSIELRTPKENLAIEAPGACPLELDVQNLPSHVRLEPRIAIDAPSVEVGYDAPFQLTLRTLCGDGEGPRGTVAWQSEGAPLREVATLEQGYRLNARTEALPRRLLEAHPGEILAISPSERGLTRVTAHWTAADGSVAQRSVVVSAAPRSRGLPNVALNERTLLAGQNYRVRVRPPGSQAEPSTWGPFTSLVPDAHGAWELVSGNQRVRLLVGSYDSVPLDCGRSDCHAAEARAAENSPMTSAFKRLLDGPGATSALACALGCHTTGEPSGADGGFSHSLRVLGHDAGDLPAWDQLPRSLRRSGGVGCLACHGPGQLPEAAARWGILRSEVCAYCHDSPPRYGHVKAWRSSGLAHSDREPLTRASSNCARCHTTWGFLDVAAERLVGSRMPPTDAPLQGIACAACHAVHDERAVTPGLLRRAPLASTYADLPESALERSSACIYCHAPSENSSPSSSLIWAGRGAIDPVSSQTMLGPAPHASVPGGCVGCHRSDNRKGEHGAGHNFRATREGCSSCHAERKLPLDLFDRARELLTRAGVGPNSQVPAHTLVNQGDGVRERAIELARLVLEDRGAAVHNPRYAEFLLDRAEQVLNIPVR
ncbi:MAG: multiheme c-type cytochrome [Myxococcota bacterium]